MERRDLGTEERYRPCVPRRHHPLAYALLVSVAYYVGAKLGFALTFHPYPVSFLWPPNAVLLAILLRTPRRVWGILLLAAFLAHVVVQLESGVPLRMILCWFVSNASEALIGAICIHRFTGGPLRFDRLRHVSIFIIFAALATFVTTFLDAAFVALMGWGEEGYWTVWSMRFFSNILAVLTVIPVMLTVGVGRFPRLWRVTLVPCVEASLFVVGLLATGLIAFGNQSHHLGIIPALVYVPLPFLLWAAVRFGPSSVSASLLAVALLAIWNTMHGRGPFTAMAQLENVLSLQIFLIVMTVPLLLLAAVMQERRETEQALRKSEAVLRESNARIRDLAGRLINAQEEERKRIARNLHDDLSQQLGALSIDLFLLKRQIHEPADPLHDQLLTLQNRLAEIINWIRELSHDLHSAVLDHLGLAAALESICMEFRQQSGIPLTHKIQGDIAAIPAEMGLCVYRVVQESLRNIARHAGATSVEVMLTNTGNAVVLRVTDNGVGFDPEQVRWRSGLGLISMEERVELFQGSLHITTQCGCGTELHVRIPLS
jgi:two-component system sensor histidine kinase UhpB